MRDVGVNETTITTMNDIFFAVWQKEMGTVRFIGGPLDGQERPAFLANRLEVATMDPWESVRGITAFGTTITWATSTCLYERMDTNHNVAFWRPSLSTGKWRCD